MKIGRAVAHAAQSQVDEVAHAAFGLLDKEKDLLGVSLAPSARIQP